MMSSFEIQWFNGTSASVVFSDGPVCLIDDVKYDTPYSIPNCPLDGKDALIAHISDWWIANKPTAVSEDHELVGQTFKVTPTPAEPSA